MSPYLKMSFQGACAVVPDVPLFRRNIFGCWRPGRRPPTQVAMLIPDMISPCLANFTAVGPINAQVIRSPHFSFMAFDYNDFDEPGSSKKVIDLIIEDPETHKKTGVVFLEYQVVSVDSSYFSNNDLECDRRVCGVSPLAGEETSLWWIPRMSEIAPGSSMASKKLNPFPPGPHRLVGTGIRAAFCVERGRFTVARLNQSSPWTFGAMIWVNGQFEADPSSYVWNRSVANKLVVESKLKSSGVKFSLEAYGETVKMLSLKSSSGDIVVSVQNMEPEMVFLSQSSPFGTYPSADPDFEAMYDISNWHGRRPLPVNGGGTGDSARPCAPGAFDGFKS